MFVVNILQCVSTVSFLKGFLRFSLRMQVCCGMTTACGDSVIVAEVKTSSPASSDGVDTIERS